MRDDDLAALMQRQAWRFFADAGQWCPAGVRDRNRPGRGSPVSIASTGFGLVALAVGVERGWIGRAEALRRASLTLDTLLATDGSRRRGIYFHFLDADTAERTWDCEASSVDTAILLAGAAVAAAYFGELAGRVGELVDAADWAWLTNPDCRLIRHGWRGRLLRYHWHGYNEALLLQLVVAGSGKLTPGGYEAWLADYEVVDGRAVCGPLFTHQFPHCFADLRGRRDGFGDYFENARLATLAQRDYAAENPRRHAGYAADCFGISACDGPHLGRRRTDDGRVVHFRKYHARGVLPTDVDDGTINPAATVASLPFCPEVVYPALHHFHRRGSGLCTFNESFPGGWTASETLGVEMGPALLMIENHRSGFVWELARQTPLMTRGLTACGFVEAIPTRKPQDERRESSGTSGRR